MSKIPIHVPLVVGHKYTRAKAIKLQNCGSEINVNQLWRCKGPLPNSQ